MPLKELWNFKHEAPILGIEIADLNGNGQEEILAYSKIGTVLILSLEGVLLTTHEITEKSSIWCAKIADLNNDGKNDLILGGFDGLLRAFQINKSYSIKPLWTHQFGASISGILTSGDIDNDKNLNQNRVIIAYSLDKSLRALNPTDGSLVWGQLFEDGVGDAILWEDIDDAMSKEEEVIACGNDGTLRIFKVNNGELIWHARFFNKMRCIARLTSMNRPILSCGGDDKLLHFFNMNTREELKNMQFEEYVWKSLSLPNTHYDKIITSSYSFAYFDESIQIDEIDFSSKVTCIDKNLEVLWEIEGKNAECIYVIDKDGITIVLIGTTTGEILVIDSNTGDILLETKKNSCINMVKALPNKNLIVSCSDNGEIAGHTFQD